MDNRRLLAMATFACVVEEGSFAGAAKRLQKAPSAVSTQISTLEKTLGVRLLYRTTRRLRLTSAGQEYLPHCEQVWAGYVQALEAGQRLGEVVEGPLRISSPTALVDLLVAPCLERLLRVHPGVSAQLIATDERLNLEAGAADIALRVGKLKALGLRARKIGQLRDTRVAAHGAPERVILLPWQTKADGQRAILVNSASAAKALVLAKMGVCVLPEPLVRGELAVGSLHSFGSGQEEPIYTVHGAGGQPSPAVQAFARMAGEMAADFAPAGLARQELYSASDSPVDRAGPCW